MKNFSFDTSKACNWGSLGKYVTDRNFSIKQEDVTDFPNDPPIEEKHLKMTKEQNPWNVKMIKNDTSTQL